MDVLDRTAIALSRAARGGFVWVAVAALRRDRGALARTAAAAWGADAAAVALSHLLGVQRPCRARRSLIACPDSPSLPSNHAATAFAAAATLAGEDRRLAWLYVPAAAVAASRVRVRVHQTADIAAGAALGLAVAEAIRRLR